MQKLKAIETAHENLKESLHEWFRVKETFDNENEWLKGNSSPQGSTKPHFPKVNPPIRKIQNAADHIVASVMMLRRLPEVKTDENFIELSDSCLRIKHSALVMDLAVQHVTNVILDYGEIETRKTRDLFVAWQNVCRAVESFARSAVKKLKDLRLKYHGGNFVGLTYEIISLNDIAEAAMECRTRLNRRNLEK
jgi:hypothetical protein